MSRKGNAPSASDSRVEAAISGALPIEELTDAEGVLFNAGVRARLELRLKTTDLGATLNAAGVTTVSMDVHGQLKEYLPDGTVRQVT